jgi:hypothetical protein
MVGPDGVELAPPPPRASTAIAGWSGSCSPSNVGPGGAIAERPATQRFPAMRCQPVRQLRTLRHDPRRVDVGVHDVVVLVDLDEVDGVAKPGVWNRSRAQRMSRQLARPRYVTHQNLNSKMFSTPGWGAGRVECKRTVNRRRGFADEVATAIQRVNAIAELTRTR